MTSSAAMACDINQEWKGGELARREALQTELGRNEGAAPARCSSAVPAQNCELSGKLGDFPV